MGETDARYKGLPRELFKDIKRAAYEAKVREMEEAAQHEARQSRDTAPSTSTGPHDSGPRKEPS